MLDRFEVKMDLLKLKIMSDGVNSYHIIKLLREQFEKIYMCIVNHHKYIEIILC